MSEFESLRAEYVCICLNRGNLVLERFEDWCLSRSDRYGSRPGSRQASDTIRFPLDQIEASGTVRELSLSQRSQQVIEPGRHLDSTLH
jgi:hypothetical protein